MFANKVALVTGGASGIGRSAAQLYAQHGAQVAVSDVDEQGGQDTVKMIEKQGVTAVFVQADVSNPDHCQQMVDTVQEAFGRLDIAFNNAGVGGEASVVSEKSIQDWDRVIEINLSSMFYCMHYEIPAMLENGAGAIINMASILGEVGFSTAAAYTAAKHGVIGLTETAAIEYSAKGIRINSVGPGFIRTPMISDLEQDEETERMLIERHPIGRLGKPDEVAELVIWLSSEKASFVSGGYYPVDGAYLAQ